MSYSHPLSCGWFHSTLLMKYSIESITMKTKTLHSQDAKKVGISSFPNFHKSGSISGMKKAYYGRDALLVRCGSYIYNVSSAPEIYYKVAH